MRFLAAKEATTAKIYGQYYPIRPFQNADVSLRDILVTDNASAGELLRRHGNVISEVKLQEGELKGFPRQVKPGVKIIRGSTVLVLRSGGIGDHVMLLPALERWWQEELRDQGIKLWLAVQRSMFSIFARSACLAGTYALPVTLEDLLKADYCLDFTALEGVGDFSKRHPTDCYLNALGLNESDESTASPRIERDSLCHTAGAKRVHEIRAHCGDRPLILLQWKASVHMRTLPPHKLTRLTNSYPQFQFIVAHAKEQAAETEKEIEEEGISAINVSWAMGDLRDLLGAISSIDAVVSTDSCGYHVAAALGKPAMAFFGSIPSDLRTRHYANVLSVDALYRGRQCASPCGRHKGECPEARLLHCGYSPCLLGIPDDLICTKFEEFARRYCSVL